MRTSVAILLFWCLGLGRAYAEPSPTTLKRQVQERDAIIRDLQRRVERLEGLLSAKYPSPRSPATTMEEGGKLDRQLVLNRSQAPSPGARSENQNNTVGVEEETARALERALVREGGLLLSPGSLEVEPRLQYTYRGSRGVGIVTLPSGAQVTNRETKQDRIDGTLGLRLGLPWSSQAEIRIPYVWTRQTGSAAALAITESQRDSGLGDVEIQLTKQLAGEKGGMPALLGSLNLKTTTGNFEPGRVSAGLGFPSLQASVTAVKRQDPLVFVGGVSYTAYRSRTYGGNDTELGNGIGFRFSTILAANPGTSLRVGLDFTRYGKTKINGVDVPGSDTVSGMMEFGLSTLVSAHTLLDLSVGFGVTPDAPNLRIGMSLPIRLD